MAADQPDPLDPLDEASLQKHLNEYHKALEEEFKVSSAKTPENVEELTHEFFKNNSAYAAAQIAWLSQHADSESVRLNAAKYIIDKGALDARADGDPIKDLLKQLTKNDKVPATAPALTTNEEIT
jgi:hypothetical protein